jgi:hypothetical protein
MKLEIQIDEKKNKIYAPLKEQWFVKTPQARASFARARMKNKKHA